MIGQIAKWAFPAVFKETKPAKPPPLAVRMKYDAAQTTAENARHWAMADSLSADGSMTPEIRRTLRNRARYETANNAYARGLVLTLAATCVGTGPRLQFLSDDEEFNSIVETEFTAWSETVHLAEVSKLRYRLDVFGSNRQRVYQGKDAIHDFDAAFSRDKIIAKTQRLVSHYLISENGNTLACV